MHIVWVESGYLKQTKYDGMSVLVVDWLYQMKHIYKKSCFVFGDQSMKHEGSCVFLWTELILVVLVTLHKKNETKDLL